MHVTVWFLLCFLRKPVSHLYFSNKEVKSFITWTFKSSFIAEKRRDREMFCFCLSPHWLQRVFVNSLWKISGSHCFIPRPDTWFRSCPRGQSVCVGIADPQCFPGSREVTSLSNCNLLDALIKRWEKSAVLPLVWSWALCCLILGMTLVFFFPEPKGGVTRNSSLYDDDVFFFF